jgi:outer membrane protein insertion porin family
MIKTTAKLSLVLLFFSAIFSQDVSLYRVNVVGNLTTSDKMIKYSSGLRDGSKIQRADISSAVTRLWDLGLFNDINIYLNNESEYGVEITIEVVEAPILNNIIFSGISIREGRLRDKIEIAKGQRVRPNDIENSIKIIKNLYKEDGYYNVEVSASLEEPKEIVVQTKFPRDLVFSVQNNNKYKLSNIVFEGNNSFSQRKLRKELTNTKQKKWWAFWVKNYDAKTFEEDKDA